MKSEAYRENVGASAQAASACPNCRTLMPSEMRFCRACGCRLGEGVEEYTETVRFDNAPSTARSRKSRTAAPVPPVIPPLGAGEWATTFAHNIREQAIRNATAGLNHWRAGRACKRVPKWMIWVFLPIIAVTILGGMGPRSGSRFRGRAAATVNAADSYLGARYKTVDGGAFIRDVTPQGSAADRAGLLGGDIITSFDGKPVKSDNDLSSFLSGTPVGKTVDVTFVRDGETKTVKLTTVSEDENSSLEEAFNDKPKGFLGVEDNFKRVQVPGMNIYGVALQKVHKNGPAYLAGLHDGDIVIEFNGTPIRTAEEFNDRIDRATPGSTVKVVVMRGNDRQEYMVKMGEE